MSHKEEEKYEMKIIMKKEKRKGCICSLHFVRMKEHIHYMKHCLTMRQDTSNFFIILYFLHCVFTYKLFRSFWFRKVRGSSICERAGNRTNPWVACSLKMHVILRFSREFALCVCEERCGRETETSTIRQKITNSLREHLSAIILFRLRSHNSISSDGCWSTWSRVRWCS